VAEVIECIVTQMFFCSSAGKRESGGQSPGGIDYGPNADLSEAHEKAGPVKVSKCVEGWFH
jgi:hypothetical protein